MPKYILSPDGSVKDMTVKDQETGELKSYEGSNIGKQISSEYMSHAGSFYDKNDDKFGVIADVNLFGPLEQAGKSGLGIDDLGVAKKSTIWDHTIGQTENPAKVGNFPQREDTNFLINPSFGADQPQTYYKNFNSKKSVFASEAEMLAGLDFHSFGVKDLTKSIFVIDYLLEAISYIAFIELVLAIEKPIRIGTLGTGGLFDDDKQYERNMELGNYGSVSYTALTRFIYEVLQYPKDKSSTGVFDRLGAFYVGFSLYLNADPQILFKKINRVSFVESHAIGNFRGNDAGAGIVNMSTNMLYYFVQSFFSLSNIGNNRLLMLIRRFHQKSDWHKNRLFKAKENERALAKDNPFERFIVELNYYYVKFIIERMNVGLRLKNYYNFIRGSGLNPYGELNQRKFNRSGRLKDTKHSKTIGDHRQSTSVMALKQLFIMPDSMKKSMEIFVKEEVKTGLDLPKSSINYFKTPDSNSKRFSKETVKKLEKEYEKEMMPFYFQDLRTNEVIGFHAFIDSITDNFNANYNPTKGFGRIDDVRHYVDTTRNVNITFTLAAMSKEDHDLMWYQINKIVSMVYPQFSEGFKLKEVIDDGNGKKFVDNPDGLQYPFTQVPTASPLIRIRLGDILKSNYSKHAIQKIHGKPEASTEDTYQKQIYLLPGEYRLQGGGIIFNESLRRLNNADEKTLSFIVNPKNLKKIKKSEIIYDKKKDVITYLSKKLSTQNSNRRREFNDYTKAYVGNNVNNPVTAAYETTFGKGLAGFITMLDVNYNDQLWETEVEGSKAPKLVKITINFAPIHDIPPGLDADGAMRAPVYNAGRIVNSMYGGPYHGK